MTEQAPTKRKDAATFVWVAALVLWVCVVWGHSLMGGDDSSLESSIVVEFFAPLFDVLGVADLDLRVTVVRKLAHFSEHAVLAILATGAMRRVFSGSHAWWLAALAICVAVPCIDETIQLFVPGRVGAVTDVLIDLAGCATGALIAWLVRCGTKGTGTSVPLSSAS